MNRHSYSLNVITRYNIIYVVLVIILSICDYVISAPSSRDIFDFQREHPNISSELASFIITNSKCYRLVGYIDTLSEDEIKSLVDLADYTEEHCFKRPSNTIENNAEAVGFTNLFNDINSKLSASASKLRRSISSFHRLQNIEIQNNDIVDLTNILKTFLLNQAQTNSCITESIVEIYKISASRRKILYATFTQLDEGCALVNGIYVNCQISEDDFKIIWKAWTQISECLVPFYNNAALGLTQSYALVSQFQKCRIEDNSNMEATTSNSIRFLETPNNNDGNDNINDKIDDTLYDAIYSELIKNKGKTRQVQTETPIDLTTSSQDTSIKYKFYSPRKSIGCAETISPSFESSTLSLSKIKKNTSSYSTYLNETNNQMIYKEALAISTNYTTCYQSRVYFDANGKYIVPIRDSTMTLIKNAISQYESSFLTSNIKVDSLVFRDQMNSVIDSESTYDALCSDFLETIKNQFYNINRLIVLTQKFLQIEAAYKVDNTKVVGDFWFYCSYSPNSKYLSCSCKTGSCSDLLSFQLNNKLYSYTEADLKFLLKDSIRSWIINFSSLTFSIYKTGTYFSYFGEYSLSTTVDYKNETISIEDKKYEFYVNEESTISSICNQINGCNKIAFSDNNSKSDKQSCFGMFKDKCRWNMIIKLENYLNTLIKFNANNFMPYRNLKTLGEDQLRFLSGFFFDGFNLNTDFIIEAPFHIMVELNNNKDSLSINFNSIDISDETSSASRSSESTNTQSSSTSRISNQNRRLFIEFGNTFDNIIINSNNYYSDNKYNSVIEKGSSAGYGNLTYYIESYEANNSLNVKINIILLIISMLFIFI